MHEQIDRYFSAETSESWVFVAMGVLAIAFASITLWRSGDLIFKGMAIPLIVVGLTQITVGGSILLRTEKQVAELKALYQRDVALFRAAESPRMEKVLRSFQLYKMIEVAFVATGVLLIFLRPARDFWLGIGLGMLVQGALMLPADILAQRRGVAYYGAVRGQ
jgi:hypothetical protein